MWSRYYARYGLGIPATRVPKSFPVFTLRLLLAFFSRHVPQTHPHTPFSSLNLGAGELYQAGSHLSAFTDVMLLALSAISLTGLQDASPEECLGSLAQTVREPRLSFCPPNKVAFFAILQLFAHLESLQLGGNSRKAIALDHSFRTCDQNELLGETGCGGHCAGETGQLHG